MADGDKRAPPGLWPHRIEAGTDDDGTGPLPVLQTGPKPPEPVGDRTTGPDSGGSGDNPAEP